MCFARKNCVVLVGVILATAVLANNTQGAEKRQGNVDMNHSTVGFEVPILGGISHVQGKFSEFWVEVDLHEEKNEIQINSIVAVIKAESVDTGIDQRDMHLRSSAFFDARKHPELRFESDRVTKEGEAYLAHGALTMRGITKEIALPIRIAGRHTNEKSGRTNVGFIAELTLDRDDYGISYRHDNPFFIGTDVRIVLQILTRSLEL